MLRIPLIPIANQEFSFTDDQTRFVLRVRTAANGTMAIDVARDNVVIVQGQRIMADRPVLPYAYLRGEAGNFIFETEGDEYPDWRDFGTTCFLSYLTAAEVEEINNAAR